MGGFGGGSLEHPGQWLGAQWADLFARATRRALRRHRSRAGALPGLHCPGGTLAMLALTLTYARP
eukprot:scaffold24537_cov43-Phaeocystis_antarctica.AAC.2